jgi:hypothetical protein
MTTTYFLDNGQNSGFNLFKEEDQPKVITSSSIFYTHKFGKRYQYD